MTRPSRDGLEPGMIVEHRQRYVVTDQRYSDESLKHAGQLKLRPVGDVEQVAIAYPSAKGSACGCATNSRRWSDA